MMSIQPLRPFSAARVAAEPEDKIWYNTEQRKSVVVLIQPFLWEAAVKNRTKFTESLALAYLSGALKKAGFEFECINAEMEVLSDEKVVERALSIEDIALVGISCKSERSYRHAKNIAKLIKQNRPDIHIAIGGMIASSADELVLADCEYLDTACRGEGEYLITELAYKILYEQGVSSIQGVTFRSNGKIIRNPSRKRLANIDNLPTPFRSDFEFKVKNNQDVFPSAYMMTSRGCFASCTFCSIHQIYGDHNVVRRSPLDIVNEMKSLIENYGVRRFSFVDDLFIMPSNKGLRWLDDFIGVLDREKIDVKFYAEVRANTVKHDLIRKLQAVGLSHIFIGIESGVQAILDRWQKEITVAENEQAINELELAAFPKDSINFGYIMFDPEMTFEELRQNYAWLRQSGFAKVQHLQNKMNVYYGTEAYNRLAKSSDTPPPALGERWRYKFLDGRVQVFEEAFRKFHVNLQDNSLEEYVAAQEEYRRESKIFFDIYGDCLEYRLYHEIMTFLHHSERQLYYHYFDECLRWLAETTTLDVSAYLDFESSVRAKISYRLDELLLASRCFKTIVNQRQLKDVETDSFPVFAPFQDHEFVIENFQSPSAKDRYESNVRFVGIKQAASGNFHAIVPH
ncbi:B12-binding domain-containing radical SAM protein [Paludibacterium purpuratum]|uniref:Radical SAM family protein n=1 Tax=Paludibacterium purpuratum TaxID=1144873 RepID=A0A4R7B620_9NEIS|nr:radical SAM protein [Paludibacterium purpuratum]TDR80068.1 radical SAM family protein [Paludibacterium purpuratum]